MSLEDKGGDSLDSYDDGKSPQSQRGGQVGLPLQDAKSVLIKWLRPERENLTKKNQQFHDKSAKPWRRFIRQRHSIATKKERDFNQGDSSLNNVAEAPIGKLEEVDVEAGVMRLKTAYPAYRDVVKEFKRKLENGEVVPISDKASVVCLMPLEGHQPVIVRFRKSMNTINDIFPYERAEALARGEGIATLEQGLAYDEDDQVIVSAVAPGTRFDQLSLEELTSLPPDIMVSTLKTIQQAYSRGLIIDADPTNIFYQSGQPLFFVDYLPNDIPEIEREPEQYKKFVMHITCKYDPDSRVAELRKKLFREGRGVLSAAYPNATELLAELDREYAKAWLREEA